MIAVKWNPSFRQLLLSVVAIVLLSAACGGGGGDTGGGEAGGEGQAGGEVKSVGGGNCEVTIGTVLGLSGANSVITPAVVQAAELAVDELNQAGGILNKDVCLKVFDDGSVPQTAQAAWDTAVNQANVDVVVAMETSAAREAGIPIAEEANVPYIYTALYEGGACNPILYVNAVVPQQMGEPMINYLIEQEGAETWFLVGSDYNFGRLSQEAARTFIEEAGAEVVGEEYNPIDATDWTAIISQVRSANPDAIMMATAGGAPNVSFLKQLRGSGYDGIVSSMSIDEGTTATIGADAQGVYMSADYFVNLDTPANEEFKSKLEEKFGDDMETPTLYSVPTYDGIFAYAKAAEQAGSIEPDAILNKLDEVTVNGPRGPVTMNQDRHATLPIRLGQAQEDGTVEIVEDFGLIPPGNQCPG